MNKKYQRKGISRFAIWMLTAMSCMLFWGTVTFAGVDKLNISQILQNGKDIYLYVNAQDNTGTPVADSLSAEQFSVNIDKKETLKVQDSAVFQSLNEGVSYIFCIDISKSVTDQEMQEIRSSISNFLNGMSSNDYARIITFGTEITSVCDSTQDRSQLNAAIQNIERTANYTYLYEGLSFALDGQRKNVETIPDRAAVILFTDGMDDSDGASSEEQVLVDIAETRIPVYVVGLKGNDADAKLNSVGQIARQSGGRVLSYNDMSVTEAVQTVSEIMRNTYQLHVQPKTDLFGSQNLVWSVTCNLNGYSVSSSNYVYSLSLDGVETEAEITEKETEPPVTTEIILETEAETEPEKSFMDNAADFLKENLIICIASALVLIALIIILVIFFKKKNEIKTELAPSFRDGPQMNQEEVTLADIQNEEEETVGEFNDFEDEETVDGSNDSGIKLIFEITFDGRTETVERSLKNQLTLGRGNECDIDVVLHSMSEERKQTSRKHAFIFDRPDGLYVKDNSKNKTYLNGVEVLEEMALRDEDILQLGKSSVKIKILNY